MWLPLPQLYPVAVAIEILVPRRERRGNKDGYDLVRANILICHPEPNTLPCSPHTLSWCPHPESVSPLLLLLAWSRKELCSNGRTPAFLSWSLSHRLSREIPRIKLTPPPPGLLLGLSPLCSHSRRTEEVPA